MLPLSSLQVVRMSPVQALFILVAITTVLGVTTYVKGQPGVYEPLRSSHFDYGLTFIDSDNQLLPTEVPSSVGATLDSGNDEKQRILTNKSCLLYTSDAADD